MDNSKWVFRSGVGRISSMGKIFPPPSFPSAPSASADLAIVQLCIALQREKQAAAAIHAVRNNLKRQRLSADNWHSSSILYCSCYLSCLSFPTDVATSYIEKFKQPVFQLDRPVCSWSFLASVQLSQWVFIFISGGWKTFLPHRLLAIMVSILSKSVLQNAKR